MADLVNDPHWPVLCTRSGPDRSSQERSGLVLGWRVSRHAERLLLCQRFDVILIPISDKVTLISVDAGVYSASLGGERNGWKVLSESALCARAENPCSGFSPVRVCVVFGVCADQERIVCLSSGLREPPQRRSAADCFVRPASPSPNNSSTPIFTAFHGNRPLLSAWLLYLKIRHTSSLSGEQAEVLQSDYLKVAAASQRRHASVGGA